MRDKLHERIETGRRTGAAAIERIMADVPEDKLVPGALVKFAPANDNDLEVHYGDVVEAVHPFALGQFGDHAHMPRTFVSHLREQGSWGIELAADTLTRIFSHDRDRHLIRSVAGETRARLSTRYRRLQPGMLLEAFQHACNAVGAVPYDATCTDTKWMVRAVVADVIEPVRDEVIALGVVIHESPFGNGATEVSPFIERMWCTNTAVCTTELRRIHIGGRLQGDIAWSDETVIADTRATALQIGDLVRGQLGPGAIAKLESTVRAANEQKIDPRQFEAFLRKNLTKEDAESVTKIYTSADIENLPRSNSIWRASNALSWFAHSVEDAERKFDIQKLAGAMLGKAA